MIDGLVALFSEDVYAVTEDGLVVWDFTAWGAIHLTLGALMILAGFGLFARTEFARWFAALLAGLNAIAQTGSSPHTRSGRS